MLFRSNFGLSRRIGSAETRVSKRKTRQRLDNFRAEQNAQNAQIETSVTTPGTIAEDAKL